MNVLFTMTGPADLRPRKDGVPPYLQEVAGQNILVWALESLRSFYNETFVFLPLKAHHAEQHIVDACSQVGIKQITIKEIASPTKGQAATAYGAKGALSDPREPLIIFGPGQFISPTELSPRLIQGDGWLPCFRARSAMPVTIAFDQMQRVTEVSEKSRLSDFAVAGFYYFRSFEIFESCRKRCHYIGYKEHSVPPLYEALSTINSRSIFTYILSSAAVWPLQTGAQLREFEAWEQRNS